MKKINITPDFILEMSSYNFRVTKAIRLNRQLADYCDRSAKKRGAKQVDFYNNLFLAVLMHEKKGFDIMSILKEEKIGKN